MEFTFYDLRYGIELGVLKTPYSKSHARREKRKAKEQLAGSGLNDIQAILSTIAADENIGGEDEAGPNGEKTEKQKRGSNSMETDQEQQVKPKAQQKMAKIGEGKSVPLSKNQRKRVLYVGFP